MGMGPVTALARHCWKVSNLFNCACEKITKFLKPQVTSVCFNDTGEQIISGGLDNNVKVCSTT